MQNRRDFLKTATLAALGSGLVVRQTLAGESSLSNVYINKLGLGGIEVDACVYGCHIFTHNDS